MIHSDTLNLTRRLAISLLTLRITIALVFTVWAIDKVVAPEHALSVFSNFYGLSLSTDISILMGISQLIFIAIFLLGIWKNITYLIIFIFHMGSTFSSYLKYFDPLNNLLFFTAWPMLAACLTLYILRDYDIWTFKIKK
ncbi:hypothetical protein PVK64_19170 [Aliivibrio sp. S4TY2]|uniref:hypothetical protein n=1 Tax=unclassified Aliivibrio TaxID=2645654 RepID=UPI0023795C5F|nr:MULTISPECIES: hypothetical protein [unclassified Aliivibrio]MDD9158288.1 hypothetical protein [Aliivibrio sp. S4TY2]MDD9162203.1 hypothetical protein [Aliivibrio sp. S4TY1]MDD9166228.1 hypothetical protein [Aliivibrio sp. S4MY2]MDD9170239.1 hypothetical protein [Aliivibrio sp. S4MY4]MDD9187290.1 hypothetical protein [Aliivibrio sp. S4MY3]